MKLNFILPGFSIRPVGGFRVVYEIANELSRRGHNVKIYHCNAMRNIYTNKTLFQTIKKELGRIYYNVFNPSVHWIKIEEKVGLCYIKDVNEDDMIDADAIFATAWQTAELINEFPDKKGKKYCIAMDFDPYFASKETLVRTWLYPMNLFAISGWLRDKIKAYSKKEATLLPLGINHNVFKKVVDVVERKNIISMMYSSGNYKDAVTGIKVLQKCVAEIPNVECIVFGPRRKRPDCLSSEIIYRGSISDEELAELYNKSAVFINTSLAEGFAFPPAEAMACGCAVACTNCGGNTDYIEDGVNVLLSETGDADAMFKNVKKLILDKELRNSISEQGTKRILEFTWKNCVDVLENKITK